jgi:hypothetical protein
MPKIAWSPENEILVNDCIKQYKDMLYNKVEPTIKANTLKVNFKSKEVADWIKSNDKAVNMGVCFAIYTHNFVNSPTMQEIAAPVDISNQQGRLTVFLMQEDENNNVLPDGDFFNLGTVEP